MTASAQTLQACLPLEVFHRLQRLRSRFASALQNASHGDFSQAEELRRVSRQVGQILASEARKSPEERGGLRLVDLTLEVDRHFPELRGWNQHESLREQRERLCSLSLGPPRPLNQNKANRAS